MPNNGANKQRLKPPQQGRRAVMQQRKVIVRMGLTMPLDRLFQPLDHRLKALLLLQLMDQQMHAHKR